MHRGFLTPKCFFDTVIRANNAVDPSMFDKVEMK